jgi:tetratricopeptide (TPR) repeat protein
MKRQVYGENAETANLADTLKKNMGLVDYDLGNYHVARAGIEKALEMMRYLYDENAKNTTLADTLKNLGELHGKLGNVVKARDYCKEAMDMVTACLGADASTNEICKRCLEIIETLE